MVHSEIMAPRECTRLDGAIATSFGNAVEPVEKRRDAQLAREIEVACPASLTGARA